MTTHHPAAHADGRHRHAVSQRLLHGESIYTLKLSRRGIRLSRGRDVDILQSVKVEEVMAYDYQTVSKNLTLDELTDLFAHTRHHGLMVLDEHNKLWGVVTLTDLDRAVADKQPRTTTVAEIATTLAASDGGLPGRNDGGRAGPHEHA